MLFFGAPPAWVAAAKHKCTDFKQIQFMITMHNELTAVLKHPTDDVDEYSAFIRQAFSFLLNIVAAPVHLGGMTKELLRQLFGMGEQTLTALEVAISRWHGVSKTVHFKELPAQYPHHKILTTHKERRHLRRDVICMSLRTVEHVAMEDTRRINEALDVVVLCGGARMTMMGQNGGSWKLPALVGVQDPRWQAEMYHYAMRALQGAAQCLGYRYIRWPVTIKGQVVPGTGVVKGEVLKDWQAVEQDDECERRDSVETVNCAPS